MFIVVDVLFGNNHVCFFQTNDPESSWFDQRRVIMDIVMDYKMYLAIHDQNNN